MEYVLSIDVGTSSARAALYDAEGRPVPDVTVHRPHAPVTTPDGGVELDADELFQSVLGCVEGVLEQAGARSKAVRGVGVSTFWHSILGVGGGGHAVTPVVMWADTRSVAEVEELKQELDVRAVHRRTGCMQHTSYPPARLRWAARHRPDWLREARCWMSPGEYFFFRLFGRSGCSVSMASGTGMYDQPGNRWDAEVVGALPIAEEQLNPIVDTLAPFEGLAPEFARRFPALAGVPWFPAAGDGALSNAGSGCTTPERIALMVGTSGAIRVMGKGVQAFGRSGVQAAGESVQAFGRSGVRGETEPKTEDRTPNTEDPNTEHRTLNTEDPKARTPERLNAEPNPPWGLWKYRLDRRRYLVGGALSNGGNLFAWMRETLRLPAPEELERMLAETEPDSHGLTVLPFLAGERCPGWRGDARAAFVGLSWSTQPEEIARAGLEAVAYRFALIHELLRDVAAPGHQIIASGGALLASPAWTQMLADALGEAVTASDEREASSRGAALLALEGTGLLRDLGEAPLDLGETFRPDPERHRRYVEGRRRQARLYEALIARDWSAGA